MIVPLTPGLRYDMPATFGASPIPDKTFVPDAGAMVLTFETTPEAARALMPAHFRPAERPMVSVSHVFYRGVDYLGGRGYNEIVVTVSAERGEGDARISAGYATVLWVDQIGALIAGREYMGLPKLLGRIPDIQVEGSTARFSCYEYDAKVLECEVAGLRPVVDGRLETLNARGGEVSTFGWKYIAAPGGTAHLDCAMLNVMRWSYARAWTGAGSVRFIARDHAEAPMSRQALAVLSELPQLGEAKAFYGLGEATIDRAATRCI